MSSTPQKSPALATLMAEYLATQFGQTKLPSKIAKATKGVEEESPLFEQSVDLFKKSLVAPVAPAAAATPSSDSSDSDSSDSDSDSSDDEASSKKATIAVTPAVTAAKKADSDSDSDSSDDEAEAKPAAAKKADSDSDSSSDSDSDSSSDSDSDAEPAAKGQKRKAPEPVKAAEPAFKKRKVAENGDSRNDEFNQANAGSNRVFIRNLSWACEEQGLTEMMQGCGTITDVFLLRDRETGRSRGSGFVTFETAEQANKALELNETEQGGRTVHVNLAEKRERRQSAGRAGGRQSGGRSNFDANKPRPDGCDTVFIGGLPYEVDEPAVREHFADCGDIAAVRWVMKDGEFKGAGFVQFASGEGAEKAFKTKNGSYMGSRSVRLDYAADRRQSRGGY